MHFIDKRGKSDASILIVVIKPWVDSVAQGRAGLDLPRMQVINIHSHKHGLYVHGLLLLHTEFLEFAHCMVTCIRYFALLNLVKVKVPLPVGVRVFVKEFTRANRPRVVLVGIAFLALPEAILATKCWNTTCSADACSC